MATSVSIGLGARQLADKDYLSKSDPFCVISRPNINGGFDRLRVSETKKNTLNPDWSDFLFKTTEISGNDINLNLKIEIYDDDGKKGLDGKDKLIGEGFFSLKQLEAANLVNTKLQIFNGKKTKPTGQLVVRSFKFHQTAQTENIAAQGYPNTGQGYPNTGQGYPGQGQGYPGQGQGYPGQGQGYPTPGQGYPTPASSYPAPAPGYPAPPTGYPAPATGYPAPAPGYPAPATGYPAPAPGYPAPAPGYPNMPGQLPYPTQPGGAYPPAGVPGGAYSHVGAPGGGYPQAGGVYPPLEGVDTRPSPGGTPFQNPGGNQMGFKYPPQ